MYYGDYGNYELRSSFDRTKDYQLREQRPTSEAAVQKPVISFPKKAEASSTAALGAYGQASFNMGQKVTASALPLTDEVQAMVGRFITPEQEQRVSANFLNYFG